MALANAAALKVGFESTLKSLAIGDLAVNEGNIEKGLGIYQSILEIEPDNKEARERVRRLGYRPAVKPPKLEVKRSAPIEKIKELMVLADSDRALAAMFGLKELLPQFPRDFILHYLKGNLERELDRIKDSIESYKESIQLNDRYSPTHLNLGLSYQDLDRQEDAISAFERAIEVDRRNYKAFYQMASLWLKRGDVDNAIEYYFRCLRICPDHVESNNELGEIFLNQKQTARATTLLERVIKTNPENAKAHFNLGIAYIRLGDPGRALEHLEKVIILEPENSEACSLLRSLKDQA